MPSSVRPSNRKRPDEKTDLYIPDHVDVSAPFCPKAGSGAEGQPYMADECEVCQDGGCGGRQVQEGRRSGKVPS